MSRWTKSQTRCQQCWHHSSIKGIIHWDQSKLHVAGGKTKLSLSSLRQRKNAIWTPFLTRKQPVPQGNTVPFRSIGWVPAPAPFPTSERGRDSQRDRSTNHGGSNPGALASEAGALPTVPRGRPPVSQIRPVDKASASTSGDPAIEHLASNPVLSSVASCLRNRTADRLDSG